jgi:hypothetical protein
VYRRKQDVQDNIVDFSEKLHKLGLRHSGLSGQLCEQLLKRELAKDTSLKFTTGQIVFGDGESSPQIDLIIHQKTIENEISGISKDLNVVPLDDVVGVIEVKKWTFPKLATSIAKSMAAIRRIVGSNIPLFSCFDKAQGQTLIQELGKLQETPKRSSLLLLLRHIQS